MLLASLSLPLATVAMTALNVACTAVLAFTCIALQREPGRPLDAATRNFAIVVVAACPFTQHVFYMGQTSLVAAAFLLAGWYAAVRAKRPLLAGLLLGVATIKPQIAALPLLWLLLERRWATLATTAASVTLLATRPLLLGGPVRLTHDWLSAMYSYAYGPVQMAGAAHVFSIQSLLASAGIRSPSLAIVAVIAIVVMSRRLRGESTNAVPGLVLAISFLFVYAHDYDLAALLPLLVSLWACFEEREAHAIVLSLAVAVLWLPQRLLRPFGHGPILHWREIVVFLLAAWLLRELLVSPKPSNITRPQIAPSGRIGAPARFREISAQGPIVSALAAAGARGYDYRRWLQTSVSRLLRSPLFRAPCASS
jgi:hypothetical protein